MPAPAPGVASQLGKRSAVMGCAKSIDKVIRRLAMNRYLATWLLQDAATARRATRNVRTPKLRKRSDTTDRSVARSTILEYKISRIIAPNVMAANQEYMPVSR
jgi:hypothetical protein